MVWSQARTPGSAVVILELKLENPLGFFESERLVEINEVFFKSLAVSGIGLRSCPPVGIESPLLDALQLQRSKLVLLCP